MWSRQSLRRDGLSLFRGATRDQGRSRRVRRRPRLELLEDRQLLSIAGAMQFDFGPPGAQVSPGYTAVGRTAFSATAGYGWQAPANVYTGADWWPDYNCVSASFIYSTNDTFEVDLPDGTYTVVPTLGSYSASQNKVAISLNGQQVASNLATAAGQHISPAYQVDVTSGRLDVHIEDSDSTSGRYFWLDALSILPGQVQPPTVEAGPTITAEAGQPVSFGKATATGAGPLSYSWYFGDFRTSSASTTSRSLNPAHTYTTPGTYLAMLTVTDANGLVVSSPVTVNVVTGSELTVNAGPGQTTREGALTTFQGSVTGGTAPYKEAWDFGDGTTATGTLTPTHVYTAPGSYTATLSVTDAAGQTTQSHVVETVLNVPPVITALGPDQGNAGAPVNFSASTTDVGLSAQSQLAYRWDFGDGATATGANPSHAFALDGTYNVSLTVTDPYGASVKKAQKVTISPSVSAGVAPSVDVGAPVSFQGTAVGSDALLYHWNFGDGGAADGTLKTTHVYKNVGKFNVTLTATDPAYGLSSSSSLSLTVVDVAPTVSLTAPAAGAVGTAVGFTASASHVSPIVQAAGFTYKWNFGDGDAGAGANPSHVYGTAGTYNVSVTATDEYGKTSMRATAAIVIAAATSIGGPTVNIDADWLQQQGSGPYLLSQADTTYVLQTDVTVSGTAFVVTATGVTFDLNGHTITYDNASPITVSNGGFESGPTPSDVPGWDVSQAPGALRKPARTGMWGNWMLELPNVASSQTITSQAIAIPRANVQYAAAITPKSNLASTIVTLSVVDVVTGAVLASKASSNANRGFAAVAQFTPTTTDPVKLVVTVGPAAGTTDTVDLDYASVMASQNYGVVAAASAYEFPAALGNLIRGHTVANFTLKNGSIQQGQGDGYGSSPIEIDSIDGCTISNVKAAASGMDTNLILGSYAKNVTITRSDFASGMDRISNRMLLFAAVNLNNAGGAIVVNDNTLSGSGQLGIYVAGNSLLTSATIDSNTSRMTSLVTDGYAIYSTNLTNFEINDNTITTTNGRGIMFDAYNAGNWVTDGTVSGNYVQVQEGPNLEVGATGQEATPLRVRNVKGTERNLTFSNNSFIALTGPGLDWAAVGARITEGNENGLTNNANILFKDNLFKAIVTDPDPNLKGARASQAWGLSISQFGAGTGTVFQGNTFESNAVSLNFGDNDSAGTMNQDVLFIGNTIRKSSDGVSMTYRGIVAGDWNNSVDNIRLIDMRYANGATPGAYFANDKDVGVKTKNVEFGYLLNLDVTNPDGTAAANATVTITDSNGKQVFSGATDAKGLLSSIPLVTQVVAQTGQGPETTTTLGAFTITVTSGGARTTQTFTLTSDRDLGMTL